MKVSKEAIDLIVSFEIGSKALYEKKYRSTEWPGVASGVTVGIGYDCGYHTAAQIRKDWGGLISQSMVEALASTAGVRGGAAQSKARAIHGQVNIPYDTAMKVFEKTSMPKWIANVQRAVPNTDKLSPTCLGVLVSLAYNRGASFGMQGDRYREMRNIKAHMASGAFNKIPGELRAMKRIWPNVRGLQRRREEEAKLFEKGLKEPKSAAQVGGVTAGGTVVAGTALATASPSNYLPYILGATAFAAALIGLYFYLKNRKNKKNELVENKVVKVRSVAGPKATKSKD